MTSAPERLRAWTALLPWAAALLVLGWAWRWLVRGQHGLGVHLLLALAFVAMTLWGALRATRDVRRG